VELIKVLKIAFEIMSEITGDKLELGNMNPHREAIPLVKTPDAPQGIPLDLVSQGYENLIGWVGYLVKRLSEVTPIGQDFRQTPAICLIDEIDTYLHPKWQSNIVSTLVDTFRNTQFIITTHSPLVLARLHKPASDYKPSYKIFKLVQQDGIVLAEEASPSVFNPYGAESSRVLRLLMNIEERPKDVKQLFEVYHRAIANNDFEAAQTTEKILEQLIDRHDPILVNGAAEIETRKIIQSL
jgi:predicted ATP-binding protein involved in virulence